MGKIGRRQFLAGAGKGIAGLAGLTCFFNCDDAFGAEQASAMTKPVKAESKPLNVVFILADDLGWKDAGCYGSDFYETPNIDKLAAEGMRFTNAYAAAPSCSPTRASIMSGKWPARLNLTHVSGGSPPKAPTSSKLMPPFYLGALPLDEITIAEVMQSAGYSTASVGKWHLGHDKAHLPDKQGFDYFDLDRGVHNFSGAKTSKKKWAEYSTNFPDIPEGKYPPDALTENALKFIEQNKDKPFFLYLPFYLVHWPVLTRNKWLREKYAAKAKPGAGQNNPTYAAMVGTVNWSVGCVLDKLEELGLAENTVVFFFSDNGGKLSDSRLPGSSKTITSNAPLRAGKVSLYEGGIREPLIVRWPGVVKAGSTCDEVVTSVDFYPTILEMTGVKADPKQKLDGVSITSLLKQTGKLDRRAVYWHFPHTGKFYGAIRQGDYKLMEFFEDDHVELYNLKDDIGEKDNLADKMPDKAAELLGKLQAWRKEVNAQMPTANPQYGKKARRKR